MAKGKLLFNLVAEGYSRSPIADMESYEKKLELTRKYMKPEHKVFEFGCGTGSTALLHAPYAGHILATDFAEKMIAIGNRHKQEQGIENVDFQVLDINRHEFEPESFDVVLGLNILQLMEDIERPIQKCWDMLKPGGYFISSSVCMTKPPGIWAAVLPFLSLIGLFPNLKGFSKEELIACHEQTGFEILERFEPEGDTPTAFLIAQKPA